MKVEPLDFDRNPGLKSATLIEVVSVIVRHYGDQGCTMVDIAGTIQRNLPQWKPSSASPSVSNLEKLGCVRVESHFGVRTIYHVRDYEPDNDRQRLNEIERTISERRAEEKRSRERVGLIKHEPVLHSKSPAQIPAGPMKMLFAFGENRTEAMTLEEARQLYAQLHAIFGGGR